MPDEIDDDRNSGKSSKTNDLGEVVFAFEADGVNDLRDEKDEDAGFGSVIDSEDNVGTKGK